MTELETYLQYNLKNGKIIRWPDYCFPLTFYIAPFRWYKGRGQEQLYYSMVTRALNAWESVSNGKCRFQLVSNLNDSQVNLEWKRVDRKSLGYCLFNFDDRARLYSAEVQIGLSDGIMHAEYMDEKEVYHTILHEIGHALGLGHSPYKSDIMYTPHQYGNTALSKRDMNSINWLYNIPLETGARELAAKYQLNDDNLDVIIYKTMHKNGSAGKNPIISTPQKDLMKEQINLAELKKYQVLGLQNVQISQAAHRFIKKQSVNMQNDNKKK